MRMPTPHTPIRSLNDSLLHTARRVQSAHCSSAVHTAQTLNTQNDGLDDTAYCKAA